MSFSLNPLFADEEPETGMTGGRLLEILGELSEEELSVQGPVIQFSYREVPLICIYDESHDRMRIISPIGNYSELSDEHKNKMLRANFHSALDARYCVRDEVLYSAYIHPLSPLRPIDILSGVHQVAHLNLTFGTSYSSEVLSFGQGDEADGDTI